MRLVAALLTVVLSTTPTPCSAAAHRPNRLVDPIFALTRHNNDGSNSYNNPKRRVQTVVGSTRAVGHIPKMSPDNPTSPDDGGKGRESDKGSDDRGKGSSIPKLSPDGKGNGDKIVSPLLVSKKSTRRFDRQSEVF